MPDVPLNIHVDTEAVVAKVMASVRVGIERARAEVAEGIAQAIEVAAGLRCPDCDLDTHLRSGDDFWCLNNHRWSGNRNLSTREAAAIARGYTQAGQEPADTRPHNSEEGGK